MAKNSGKTSHEASLKQRQLNGINKIANSRRDAPNQAGPDNRMQRPSANGRDNKGKSLLDRMTASPTTNSTADARDPLNASPRKRKRQKSKSRDADGVEDKSKDPPAKRQKPQDSKAQSQSVAHQEAPKKTSLWQNIKTKKQGPAAVSSKQDVPASSEQNTREPPSNKRDAPSTSSSKQTEDTITSPFTPPPPPPPPPPSKPHENKTIASINNNDPYPSPPSEQPSTSLGKRGADDPDAPEQASKKARTPYINKTMQPVDAATAGKRQAYLKPSAPAVANPDCEHVYRAWGNDSVPLLFSLHARDGRQDVLLNNPSVDLRCRAIALLESPKGFAPNDLGRPIVKKKGRSKIFDDLDLYLMEDQKVYVATERGLLLVADYLKLAGISDSTPVRFNGIKPAYVKAHPPTRFCRWVSVTTSDPSAHVSERARLEPGELPLLYNEMVEIWAVDPRPDYQNRVFGRLIHDGQTGWFDFRNTVASRKDLPKMEDATEPIFEKADYQFSRNDPPASAAQIASLKYVKTYVSERVAHPAETATAPSATAPPVALHTPSKPATSQKTPTSNAATPSKAPHPTNKEALKETKAGVKIPEPPKDTEAKSKDGPSSDIDKIETERIENDVKKVVEKVVKKDVEKVAAEVDEKSIETVVEKIIDTTAQEDGTPVPEVSNNTISQETEVEKQDVEKEDTAASNTSSSNGPARLSMHAYCDEDDVDWGDEEL